MSRVGEIRNGRLFLYGNSKEDEDIVYKKIGKSFMKILLKHKALI